MERFLKINQQYIELWYIVNIKKKNHFISNLPNLETYMNPSKQNNYSSIGQSFGFSCDGTLRFSNAMRFIEEKRLDGYVHFSSISVMGHSDLKSRYKSGSPRENWILDGISLRACRITSPLFYTSVLTIKTAAIQSYLQFIRTPNGP